MAKSIGFVGLGNMGKPMAINLARAGFPLTVYDVRAEPLAELAALGAHVARSTREVGERCEIIETVVVDDTQVEAVMLGTGEGDGVLAGAGEGAILVIHSTVSPLTCHKIAAAAEKKAVQVLDAAVSGAEERSAAGTLSLMVGGDTNAVEACQPVFEVLGERTYHVGALGQGLAAKLCNNLMLLANMQTLEEALRLAGAAGIAEETMVEIASTSTGDSWAVRNVFAMREMMERHPQGVAGARQIGVKDLSLAASMARELELDAPIAEFFAGRPWS